MLPKSPRSLMQTLLHICNTTRFKKKQQHIIVLKASPFPKIIFQLPNLNSLRLNTGINSKGKEQEQCKTKKKKKKDTQELVNHNTVPESYFFCYITNVDFFHKYLFSRFLCRFG